MTDATPCPEIAVYQIVSGPCAAEFIARYAVPKHNPKTGERWFEFLPIVFAGKSYDDVMLTARQFWLNEQAKIAAKAARLSAMAESPRKADRV